MLHARSSSRFGTGPSQHLHHPNICTIHEINETDDGQLYLVMAHYEGETLKERIAGGPDELEEL